MGQISTIFNASSGSILDDRQHLLQPSEFFWGHDGDPTEDFSINGADAVYRESASWLFAALVQGVLVS